MSVNETVIPTIDSELQKIIEEGAQQHRFRVSFKIFFLNSRIENLKTHACNICRNTEFFPKKHGLPHFHVYVTRLSLVISFDYVSQGKR